MAKKNVQIPKEMKEFYRDLAEVRNKYIESGSSLAISETNSNIHVEQKVPLLSFVDLALDESKLKKAFAEIISVIFNHRSQIGDELSAIENAVLEKKGVLSQLCDDYIWHRFEITDKFAQENGLNRDILSLALFHTVKPFATSYSLGLQNVMDSSKWQESYCPVCGWAPDFAYEEQDTNKRKLHCSMCDTMWEFKNLKCPHCGNEEHKTLKYFSVDGDEIYCVYVCDECHGYIKSVNKGKLLKENDYAGDDLNTLYLDLLARKEGYTREPEVTKGDLN